ncbi:MAG: glutathione peroxidase [Melioribacteraceae bacterium]|nr:glutathione peroxidase [Melioribacteraceae bacterium]
MILKIIALIFLISVSISAQKTEKQKTEKSVFDIAVKDIDGKDVQLSEYKGKVLLIVNVASKCGYTPQYEGLQKIYEKFNEQGFEILAFPCNDFGAQEPGSNEQIQNFCSVNYGVTFRLFDKIKVIGDEKSPLYSLLINNPGTENGDVKWNFEKFLIGRDGEIVKRFRSKVKPESRELLSALEYELKR